MDALGVPVTRITPYFSESGSFGSGSLERRNDTVNLNSGTLENLNLPTIDRVDIQGGRLVVYAAQEFSFQQEMVQQLADGSFRYRQTSIEASQEILIQIQLPQGVLSEIGLGEAMSQLEAVVADLQQGFRDSLRGLMNRLQPAGGAAMPLGPSVLPALSGALNGPEGDLLDGYLNLLKQLGGDDPLMKQLIQRIEDGIQSMQPSQPLDLMSPGRTMRRFELEMSRYEYSRTRFSAQSGGQQIEIETIRETETKFKLMMESYEEARSGLAEGEPLVFDLDGDGIELRSYQDGVLFDIDRDGELEKTGFVTGDDALLALDKNGNSIIDDAGELFGDQTGAENGFEDLRRYDSNGDGVIDEDDPVFENLVLFRDSNGNGATDAGELLSLESQDINSIHLNYKLNPSEVAGNRITDTASFFRNDGSSGTIAETYFKYLD